MLGYKAPQEATIPQEKNIGLLYNQYGQCVGVNPNLFVAYFLEHNDMVVSDGIRYYVYKRKHVWAEISEFDVKRKLRQLLHSHEEDVWSNGIERSLVGVLPLESPKAELLRSAENYINLRNGLINLDSFELEPHQRDVFSTLQLPIEYDPDAKCPNFRAFLRDVFMGDKELVRLLQECMGYAISPSVEAQKFFILYSDGASGKSTFCDILFELAGGAANVSCVALADLGKRFQRSQLVDKVLNLSTESDVSGILDTQAIKAITSGDPIQIERKGENPFTYKVNAKIVAAVNHLPYPRDKSYAFVRRMTIIPFLRRFVDDPKAEHEAKIDREIKSRLLDELPGILNFALNGLRRLRENELQFSESKKAKKIIASYERDVNPLLDFVKVCVTRSVKDRISTDAFYAIFREWCYENGHTRSASLTKRRFLHELRVTLRSEGITFREQKSNGRQFFQGIKFSKAGGAFVPREYQPIVEVDSIDDLTR